MTKKFLLKATEVRALAPGFGGCFATDHITVDGCRVGYMYREEADGSDSGWRFFSGLETQDYVDDPSNTGFYDVNTIANYDVSIVALLGSPVGTAFERTASGTWIRIDKGSDGNE